jgi:hypothetical protein
MTIVMLVIVFPIKTTRHLALALRILPTALGSILPHCGTQKLCGVLGLSSSFSRIQNG